MKLRKTLLSEKDFFRYSIALKLGSGFMGRKRTLATEAYSTSFFWPEFGAFQVWTQCHKWKKAISSSLKRWSQQYP